MPYADAARRLIFSTLSARATLNLKTAVEQIYREYLAVVG